MRDNDDKRQNKYKRVVPADFQFKDDHFKKLETGTSARENGLSAHHMNPKKMDDE